jgi:hypothetical protein
MTSNNGTFTELDGGIVGSVKFDYGSTVDIRDRGTIIFKCQNGEQRALTNVYYIARLRSNIINIGQLHEFGCQVLVDSGILCIRNREHRLLAKVKCSKNRLYMLDLKIM